MDELLAGFGKLLGTLQLGSIAEWVAGVIAAVALLVAIVTQRRQQDEAARAESMLLRVGYTTKMSSETTTQQHYIKLTSNSEKFMREVSIVGWSPMPQIGLFKRTDTRPVEMLPYAENKLYGFRNDRYFRIYVGDVAPGEIVQLGFDAPRESAPIFVVYYDDYRGTSWEYDTSVSRRRKARWLYRKR